MSSAKRLCTDSKGGYGKQLEELKTFFESKINVLERKMDILINTCSTLITHFSEKGNEHECCSSLVLTKVNFIEDFIKTIPKLNEKSERNTPVVLLPNGKARVNDSNNPQVIALNSEEDLPNGSWLGDKDNPKARVRVKISPSDLFHINERCLTPEKMALTLLDYLFPREVLAVSNLSGKGKHCKLQLDPLLIYAIRCHLVYTFNISDDDWHRIKQNIDSKCRAVWRKKTKGLPISTTVVKPANIMLSDHLSEESSDGGAANVLNFSPIKFLKQNKDQILHIQEGHKIKVFTDEEFKELLPTSVELFSVEDSDCFSLADQQLIVTDNSSPEKVLDEDQLT